MSKRQLLVKGVQCCVVQYSASEQSQILTSSRDCQVFRIQKLPESFSYIRAQLSASTTTRIEACTTFPSTARIYLLECWCLSHDMHLPDTQTGRSLAQNKRTAAATLFVREVDMEFPHFSWLLTQGCALQGLASFRPKNSFTRTVTRKLSKTVWQSKL